jgi:hypothetical protein
MDRDTGIFDHIEDVLVNLHSGQWFGWSDSKNKIYANLVIHDDSKTKPTEKSLTDALAKQQSDFDAQEYARARQPLYPDIGDQLDDLYHKGAFSDEMAVKIKAVKDAHPKPE